MHVAISLLTLAPGELGGSETSARALVRALARVGELEYSVYVPSGDREAAGGLRVVEAEEPPPPAERGRARLPGVARSARRVRDLPARLRAPDVVHYAVTTPEPPADAPTVVTLDDAQHRDLPEPFGPPDRARRRVAWDRAARDAEAVVVPSEHVRGRVAEVLELPGHRVHVIPPGIDHELFRPGTEQREPFVLYPARPLPHKNHTRLLEAFASLRTTRPRLRLVLAGADLERLGPLPEGIERWGQVTPERLATLYRRAACVVYPSVDEGFGLAVLEAMASACPVAAANAGALPEVCDGAAVLFDPADPEAMAAAILETDDRREELAAQGLERAAAFTWDEAARRHDALYRDVGS